MSPDKTLHVSGTVEVTIEDNRLTVAAKGGLVIATTGDTSGGVVYVYHPLSGWYIEVDTRFDKAPSE